ncbi:hypothetical protein [Paludifilum halophilum]|uniref:Uncharacterized protein n=1 Tax=Paludifilum halophilum TaxID=1642702 RepID=A0A235B4G2_9BACL|nr:hypothetical protein [Paludifilum halophilum]OYD07190.1 hypothetical protein CHM34_12455 [Paludifilum halophilum]
MTAANPSKGCPVCNGFEGLNMLCPQCGEMMEDRGRFLDLLADYSPYRPIDDLKRTDGYPDLDTHQCPHTLYCRNCGHDQLMMVAEILL